VPPMANMFVSSSGTANQNFKKGSSGACTLPISLVCRWKLASLRSGFRDS